MLWYWHLVPRWMHLSPRTPYEYLGVSPDASTQEIEVAFSERIKSAHEHFVDRMHSHHASRYLNDLQNSYKILRDPFRRIQYERTLSIWLRTMSPWRDRIRHPLLWLKSMRHYTHAFQEKLAHGT